MRACGEDRIDRRIGKQGRGRTGLDLGDVIGDIEHVQLHAHGVEIALAAVDSGGVERFLIEADRIGCPFLLGARA